MGSIELRAYGGKRAVDRCNLYPGANQPPITALALNPALPLTRRSGGSTRPFALSAAMSEGWNVGKREMKLDLNIMKSKKVFLKKTTWSIAGTGVNVVVQGIYFLLLARALGPKEYGAYIAILSLSRIFSSFSNWGYGNLLIKNTSRDKKLFRNYWGKSFEVTIFGTLIFSLIVFIIAQYVINVSIRPLTIVLLCVADIGFGRVIALCQQAYQAHERMDRYAQLQIGSNLFRLFGVCLLYLFVQNPSAEIWVYLYFFTGLIPAIASIMYVNSELGNFIFDRSYKRDEFAEGFYFSVSQASLTIYNDIDKTLLAKLSSLDITGLYSAAYKFVDFAFTPINGLLISTYSNYFVYGKKGIRGSLSWAMKFLPWTITYGITACIVLYFSADLLPLLIGPDYYGTSIILKWLSPLIIFRSIQFHIADILTGSDHQSLRTLVQIYIAILNFVLTIFLVKSYSWFGAVVASIFSDSLSVILLLVFILVNLYNGDHAKN